jgi:hypothetical protein
MAEKQSTAPKKGSALLETEYNSEKGKIYAIKQRNTGQFYL